MYIRFISTLIDAQQSLPAVFGEVWETFLFIAYPMQESNADTSKRIHAFI